MVELLFLPSVYAPCPTCHGARYNAKTLEIKYPRQDHRRRAGDDGRRGVGVLRRRRRRCAARSASCAKSAWATCGSASRRPSSPAARRSASSSRPNCSARSAATRSMCSTSRRPACIPSDVEKLMTQLDGLVEAGNTVDRRRARHARGRGQRLGHRHRPGRRRRGRRR